MGAPGRRSYKIPEPDTSLPDNEEPDDVPPFLRRDRNSSLDWIYTRDGRPAFYFVDADPRQLVEPGVKAKIGKT